jgi:hypothetical protein
MVKTYRYEVATDALEYIPEMDRPNLVQADPSPPGLTSHFLGNGVGLSPDGDSLLYVAPSGELRLWREGAPTRVISSDVTNDPARSLAPAILATRFSESGSSILLLSKGPLRGETRHPVPGVNTTSVKPHVYRYLPAGDELACVSCKAGFESKLGASFTSGIAGVFGGPQTTSQELQQSMTPDGSLFAFTTDIPLTEDDRNSRFDVYRWRDGELKLVSSGATGAQDQLLFDISEDGEEIFILSRDKLVAWDIDNQYDVYVAKVGGGFDPPAEDVDSTCVGDACQGATVPGGGTIGPAGSESIAGAGDAKPDRSSVRLTAAQVRVGRVVTVAVRVSGPGRVRVAGAGVRGAAKSVSRAGRYRVSVRLTAKSARQLARRGKLSRRLRLTFTPRAGDAVVRRVSVRFKTKKAGANAPASSLRKGR